jgi:hypothetical protein
VLTSYVDEKIAGQTKDLKAHADSLQAKLADMIERTVNVSNRVAQLEQDVTASKHALHI